MDATQVDVIYNPAYEGFFNDPSFYKVLYGSAGCFDGDTIVCTSQGHKAIKDINTGEKVLSFNVNTQEPEFKKVVNNFCYEVRTTRQKILTFVFIDYKITCTDEHRFYIDGTWVMAKDIAKRRMATCCKGERDVLYKQHGSAYDYKLEKCREVGGNEASKRRIRVSENHDCNQKAWQGIHHKDTQACCGGICAESARQTRGKSQEWGQNGQPTDKSGVGYTSGEYAALVQERVSDQSGVEKSNKQANRRPSKGNKKNVITFNNGEKGEACGKVWCVGRDYKAYGLQTRQSLAAREINIESIVEIITFHNIEYVYDLEVEDNHNYTVTEHNIIVHNSGKSYATAQKIIHRCINEPSHHAWCFRKVSTFILESVFAQLIQAINDFGVRSLVKINKTARSIYIPHNGNYITCTGLDDEEKIKSISNMTIAWLEETTEFEEQDINQIDLRMRGESPVLREMIMTFNPISELHWIKTKYFDNLQPDMAKRLFTLHTTYKDNLFLDEEYIQRLETIHSHDVNNYRVYVKGQWGKIKTDQEYYKWFTDNHIEPTKYNPSLPLHITWDFNVLPYVSLSLWQIHRVKAEKDYWLVKGIDEILGKYPNNTTEATCHMFMDKWGDKCTQGVLLYGDATGRARKTSSTKTDYMIIEQILGHLIVEVRVPRSNPLPSEVHTFMNRMMYGSLPVKILVDPSMKFTIQDFTHVLEDGTRRKVKQAARDPVSKQVIEKYGHLSDAADYLFMEAFKMFRA